MSKYPVKRKARPVRVLEGDVVEFPPPALKRRAGISFRYSYAEVSAVGNSAQFKARRASYEDGKLSAESLEGELDHEAYERLMNDTRRFFADQTALYLQALRSFLLPFNKDRE